jgi:hypothetical protein
MMEAVKKIHWTELIPDGSEFDEKAILTELSDLIDTHQTLALGCIAAVEILIEGICSEELRISLMEKPPDAHGMQVVIQLKTRLQNALKSVLITEERKRVHGIRRTKCRGLASNRGYPIIS